MGGCAYSSMENLLDFAYADYYSSLNKEEMTKEGLERDEKIFRSKLMNDKQIGQRDCYYIIKELKLI